MTVELLRRFRNDTTALNEYELVQLVRWLDARFMAIHNTLMTPTQLEPTTITHWIPVADRLPPDDDDVLLLCSDNKVALGFCDPTSGRWWLAAYTEAHPTHWMPFPDPPPFSENLKGEHSD